MTIDRARTLQPSRLVFKAEYLISDPRYRPFEPMRKLLHHEIPRVPPDELSAHPRYPVCAVLDNVRSAYNVGAVLRTADAFRLEAVYLTGITCTGDHRSVHKTALGAQDSVPWTYRESAVELVRELKAAGRQIAALEITDAPTPLRSSNLLSYPLCLIIGNELTGVDPKLLAESDHALEIPQYGAKQSLNVAVAFGIAAYALVEEYHSREESHPGRTANRQRERKVL